MITLQKLLNELKPESLNEIVAGKHGSKSHGSKSKSRSRSRSKSRSHTRYY